MKHFVLTQNEKTTCKINTLGQDNAYINIFVFAPMLTLLLSLSCEINGIKAFNSIYK